MIDNTITKINGVTERRGGAAAIAALAAGLLICAVHGGARAQFGGFLGGGDRSGEGASAEGRRAPDADKIVERYTRASLSVLKADAELLAALGLKEEGERTAALALSLTAGPTTSNLEQASKLQTENSKAIKARLEDKQGAMDAASKRRFAAGTQLLAQGVIQYIGVSRDVAGYKPGIDALGSTARSTIFIAKDLPSSVPALGRTLKAASSFSRANKIPVPKDADAATAML